MKRASLFVFSFLVLTLFPSLSNGKELPKIAIWDLSHRNIPQDYSQQLTDILATEVTKLGRFEVYSQENVRTLAGWEAQKMQLGCNDSKCLTALGQMDIAKLISGSVGKLGNRYSISLSLFDTAAVKSENRVSEFCNSENELIELIQVAVRKLLGEKTVSVAPSGQAKVASPPPPTPPATKPSELQTPPSQQVITTGTWEDSVTGMEFVFVKGGCFQMGDTFGDGRHDETPFHEVCVDDFYLGQYEVTQYQWEKVMGNNPSLFKGRINPVEQVSWNDVQIFIDRLNNQSGWKYRLPTEAEWEYAARSGGKREKYSGTSQKADLRQYAWYGEESGGHHQGGEKRPNGLDLYDMTGNVWEWCADWYGENYYLNSPRDNPRGPGNGRGRVVRGGSWTNSSGAWRVTYRDWGDPAARSSEIGFRLAAPHRKMLGGEMASPPPPAQAKSVPQPPSPPSTVKAQETGRDGRFIAYKGTVLDTKTGLMWAPQDNDSDIKWPDAKRCCENYRGGGYTDWRMPTRDELAGLYDSSKSYVGFAKLIQLSACCYWTSETRGFDAAYFHFYDGGRYWTLKSNGHALRALPVRSGK